MSMVMPSIEAGRSCQDTGDERLRVILYTDVRELTSPGGYIGMANRIEEGDVLWISRPAALCRTSASDGLASVSVSPLITTCAFFKAGIAATNGSVKNPGLLVIIPHFIPWFSRAMSNDSMPSKQRVCVARFWL